MPKPHYIYDRVIGSLYIYLGDALVVESVYLRDEVGNEVAVIDYDEHDIPVGVEIMGTEWNREKSRVSEEIFDDEDG